ncbi:MAG: DUF5667 domain-containing protein [Patescibacteria group bacterium]|nr:DUF5667 domain-containing protein [Patescibacteria group bacterium]
MKDQELLKKLNNFQEIKPDQAWKKSYREILFSQISASRPIAAPQSDIRIIWESIMPWQILTNLAKPVWMASLASVLIMVVGLGGVYASKNSKPGDSLYIAKIISEKAQFAMAFDEKDKAKLGVEFASNRTREIIEVLKESDQAAATNDNKLETLSQNFKKEISQVKTRLSTIKKSDGQPKDDETEVFGANLGKNDQRMEIAVPAAPAGPQIKSETPKPITAATPEMLAPKNSNISDATSTPSSARADKMLEEAEKLFDEKNYDGTISKLEEVNKAIDQSGSGQVKGESETASSTGK